MKFAAILIFTALSAGCSLHSAPAQAEWEISVFEDDIHIIRPSLETVGERLTQPEARARASSAGTDSAALIDIDGDTLSTDSDIPYTKRQSHKIQLGTRLKKPLTRSLSLTARASAFYGRSRYSLPEGVSPFDDPITLSFRTRGAEIGTGLAFETGNRLRSTIELGGGQTFTQTRTDLESSLLGVISDSSDASHFVYTAIEVGLRPKNSRFPELSLRTEAKYYPGLGTGGLQTGLVASF